MTSRHFLTVDDLSVAELHEVLDGAVAYRRALSAGDPHRDLAGATLGTLFEKPSTRTRVSFETGMTQLGGHAIVLGPDDTQLGRGEPIKDTARALSRYVDAVAARLFDHGDLEELAAYSSVPVVNALTDRAHPCQALADLLTIRDAVGFDDVTAAWVGDGNNVARSFAVACAMAGVDLTVATPPGYGLDDDTLDRAADHDGTVETAHDPEAAVAGADVVYTDVWVSMGDEDERDERLADFEGYGVDADLLAAGDDPIFMHCLPAHRGEEVTDDVIEGDRSAVFRQAENRLHAQKALLSFLNEGRPAPGTARAADRPFADG